VLLLANLAVIKHSGADKRVELEKRPTNALLFTSPQIQFLIFGAL